MTEKTENERSGSGPAVPIFVIEGHDVGIYRTVESAQNAVEPIDVEDEVCLASDRLGRQLSIATDGTNTFISLDEEALPGSAELESALRHYLVAMGDDRARRAIDLPALVELAEARAR